MMYRFFVLVAIFLTTNLLLVWARESRPRLPEPVKHRWQLLRTITHPAPSYTQGLLWHKGSLYESVGLYGQSEIRELDAQTGKVLQRRANTQREFGEGLALKDDVLIQLTYKEGYALRFKREGLKPLDPAWRINTEGWGLVFMPDRKHFARSDGSAYIRFHNSQNFKEEGGIHIRRRGVPLANINELEYARGLLYANIYGTDAQAQRIIEIDPKTGKVSAEIDLSMLCQQEGVAPNKELNGIAYNPNENVFYVTGKNWKNIYVLRW